MSAKLPDDFATMCDFRSHSFNPLTTQTLRWLKNSAITGHCKILCNELGDRMGYIAWAEINRESLDQLYYTGKFPNYVYEWEEGKIRLILEISLEPANRRALIRELRQLLRSWRVFAYKRRELRVYVRRHRIHRRLV